MNPNAHVPVVLVDVGIPVVDMAELALVVALEVVVDAVELLLESECVLVVVFVDVGVAEDESVPVVVLVDTLVLQFTPVNPLPHVQLNPSVRLCNVPHSVVIHCAADS